MSAAFVWQRTLGKLFKLAEIEGGHAHRFRHTFAAGLLLAGVPTESASALLRHTSVKTTISQYSPWVLARQKQLEEAVRKTWKLSGTVTPRAHQK